MTNEPKKSKREVLDEYLSRPEVPPEVKEAWKELDDLVARISLEAAKESGVMRAKSRLGLMGLL